MTASSQFSPSLLTSAMSRKVSACVLLVGLVGCERVLASELENGAEVTFDIETLKTRGIDPKLAAFFSRSARFLPGRKEVMLFVNEDRVGSVLARFDDQGQLCLDKNLLTKAGLKTPESASASASIAPPGGIPEEISEVDLEGKQEPPSKQASKSLLDQVTGPVTVWAARPALDAPAEGPSVGDVCYDFKAAYPQTEVDLRPGKQEVHLIVPQEALMPIKRDFSDFNSGGVAGLLNYDVLSMQSSSQDMESSYSSISTEAGLNIGDWALRSRQNWIDQNGARSTEHLYAYAERTFLPLDSIIQIGQVNIANPVFAGAGITGLQLLPDTALSTDAAGGATIEGIANTSQARVEVKQDGVLIHTAVVPVGPFTLRNIQLIRANSNVDVTVIEADGGQHSFSLPAASLRVANLNTAGLSMALGKVRDEGDSGAEEPEVFTVSNDWLVGSKSKVAAGLMLTGDYTAIGWVMDTSFSTNTAISLSNVLTKSDDEGEKGFQSSITARTKLSERVTASGSVTQQSEGYRDLLDTTVVYERYPIYEDPTNPDYRTRTDEDDRSRAEYSGHLGFRTDNFGGGSFGFVQSRTANGEWNRNVLLSWGKSFNGATVSATLQRDLDDDSGNAAFLSVSLPLGERRSIQSRVSKSGDDETKISATYNERVADDLNYSINATQQRGGEGTDFAGNVSATPRYAQVNLGYSQDADDSTSYNANIRGGLAFHRYGVTPSPYEIQDTFGIAKVGDEGGIKLRTPNGNVWTDAGGRAVISQIKPYSDSRVEIATESLPRNVDIENGYRNLAVGRGSVSLIEFGVVKVRRLLLDAVDQDGNKLPKGASVVGGADDAYITTVVDDGKIFLEDTAQTPLKVNLPGGRGCELDFELAEEPDLESYFEHASAVCRSK